MVEAILSWKTLLVLGWLGLLFVMERLAPAARPTGSATVLGPRRLLRNGALWLLNVALSPLAVVPISAWAASVGAGWPGLRPDWWSGLPGLVLDVLILDMLIYWWHRLNHTVPFLWRFHEIHHLDQFLDTTSAVRFHFGEVLLSAGARAAIIIALGMPLVSVLVFEILVLLASLFHHSNVRLPRRVERALSAVVVTPSIHWVHHHAVRADTDSNYATILSVWDPLFGSRSPTARRPDMPIGVEREHDRPMAELILRPFRGAGALTRRLRQGRPRATAEDPYNF